MRSLSHVARSSAVVVGLWLYAPAASAVVIDFDGLPGGTAVSTQYDGVIFSTSPGKSTNAFSFAPISNSSPNILCTGPVTGGCEGTSHVFVDFTTPVNNLTLWAIEANNPVAAVMNVYQDGHGMLRDRFLPLYGRNGPGNVFVDLSAYVNVTRLEIFYSDYWVDPTSGFAQYEGGVGYDTFSFEPIPEPSTALLLAAGLAFLSIVTRR